MGDCSFAGNQFIMPTQIHFNQFRGLKILLPGEKNAPARSERLVNFSHGRASIASFSGSDISSAAEAQARKKRSNDARQRAIESTGVQFFLRAAPIFMCTPVSLSGPTIK